MNSLFGTLIGEATLLTARGNLLDATAAIQRALSGSLPMPPMPSAPGAPAGADATVLDGLVREVPDVPPGPTARSHPRTARGEAAPSAERSATRDGSFEAHQHSGRFGTRSYKLFVPGGPAVGARPLIVMLHGCSQSPDDFAAGTRMNEVAQERGFLVLYPAQAPRSNQSKCWNWFAPADQHRDGGEPGLLAEMTRQVAETHGADPRRIHVAGLSAGAAMADILGREYPDLFAAVGVHSGLPQGAAHDVGSAFAAMHRGASTVAATPFERASERRRRGAVPDAASAAAKQAAPTIVFHGDADATVHPSNGDQVIDAALQTTGSAAVQKTTVKSAAGGRAYTRTVHRRSGAAPSEASLAEHWVIHGAGHAWSGGSAKGSYADAGGPDASREMIRFFEEHPLPDR
jgi:poly(hydroxyalkanoate) depolymerase family esterase